VKPRLELAVRMASWMRFMRDRRGVSAIEFAMIAPILLLIYVGVAETGNALTVYRRTSTVAATASDLTAQVKTVSTADLQDVVAASSSILTPYDTAPLKIVISSVVADNNNQGKVAWSYANKGTGRGVNSAYTIPAGLTEPGNSVIVAEITYAFTPLLDLPAIFSPGAFDIARTFYTRPRRSLTVAKTN
jgi:Flp pilus assembly protein TadG